jgi:dynein heavy chain
VLEAAIGAGQPVLLENVGETLDPVLEQLLHTKRGSSEMIKLGDRIVDMAPEFMLYVTTKLPTPHYSPEICVQLTILNFRVNQDGLLD